MRAFLFAAQLFTLHEEGKYIAFKTVAYLFLPHQATKQAVPEIGFLYVGGGVPLSQQSRKCTHVLLTQMCCILLDACGIGSFKDGCGGRECCVPFLCCGWKYAFKVAAACVRPFVFWVTTAGAECLLKLRSSIALRCHVTHQTRLNMANDGNMVDMSGVLRICPTRPLHPIPAHGFNSCAH